MTLAQLLAQYGYMAVFAGSLLEGETILVLAGYAAHEGYLSLPSVMGVAFLGGTLGDQIFFWVGRRWGGALLRRFPRLDKRARTIRRLTLRHHSWLIVGVRFMYGFRIVGPIVIGMSEVSAKRFLMFNVMGAVVWAVAIAGAGFLFGQTLTGLLAHAERYEGLAVGLIVVLVLVANAVHRRRSKRRSRASGADA